jgi:hypothetical protein
MRSHHAKAHKDKRMRAPTTVNDDNRISKETNLNHTNKHEKRNGSQEIRRAHDSRLHSLALDVPPKQGYDRENFILNLGCNRHFTVSKKRHCKQPKQRTRTFPKIRGHGQAHLLGLKATEADRTNGVTEKGDGNPR